MLGFGVIVGSLVGGTSVATLGERPADRGRHGPPGRPRPRRRRWRPRRPAAGSGGGGGGGAAAAGGEQPRRRPRQTRRRPRRRRRRPTTTTGTDTTSAGLNGLPPVKHVFMIVLSDRGFTQSFDTSSGYLSGALRREGELVAQLLRGRRVRRSRTRSRWSAVRGRPSRPPPTARCSRASSTPRKGPSGQVIGNGCDYPASTKTLAGELTSAGDTWKAYVQGVPSSAKSACRVPKPGSKVPQTGTVQERVPGVAQPVPVLPLADRRIRLP